MIKIHLYGQTAEILPGFHALAGELGLVPDAGGVPVEVRKQKTGLHVSLQDGTGVLSYGKKPEFFRALGHLAAHLAEPKFEVSENGCFDTLCVMADASRNAVPTVGSVKRLLRRMALMGYNMFMLYTEDTYEVPGHPYIGYMRGRYSFEELKECDDYADLLGIEMVPCIQTLAHLPRLLQWQCYEEISDTEEILLAGEEETYRLLEDMIRAAARPFRSKRIHIGMDEAHLIGLGKYLSLHGARQRFDILNEHLSRVVEITEKYELRPMIWSDMYYRLVNPSGDYTAEEIPKEVTDRIPGPVQLVYWNYYSSDKEVYLRQLRQHGKMKSGTIFAGGVWTWNGTSVSLNKTVITTLPAVEACKETGVREVIVTLWGDDGSETDLFQALPGLQLYAELCYGGDKTDVRTVEQRFRECTGGSPQAFLDLDLLDNIDGNKQNREAVNPSKLALYQDVMMGLFDCQFEGLGLSRHYRELAGRFQAYAAEDNPWAYLFRPLASLCEVLSVKAELGIRLKKAYDAGDRGALDGILGDLDIAHRDALRMKEQYRELWLHDFKPFGFEVFDIRLGGVATRLEYAQARVKEYLDGKVTELPELAEERLPHKRRMCTGDSGLCRFNRWHRTVTTSYIGHNIP